MAATLTTPTTHPLIHSERNDPVPVSASPYVQALQQLYEVLFPTSSDDMPETPALDGPTLVSSRMTSIISHIGAWQQKCLYYEDTIRHHRERANQNHRKYTEHSTSLQCQLSALQTKYALETTLLQQSKEAQEAVQSKLQTALNKLTDAQDAHLKLKASYNTTLQKIHKALCSSSSHDTYSTLVIDQHILITGVNSVLDQIQQRERQLLDTDAKLQQSLALISSLETQIASLRTDITRSKTIGSQTTALQIDHQSQVKTTKAKLQASQRELRMAQSATQHITNNFNALEFKYEALVRDNTVLGAALYDTNQEVNRKVKQCRTRDSANSKLLAAATLARYTSLKDQY